MGDGMAQEPERAALPQARRDRALSSIIDDLHTVAQAVDAFDTLDTMQRAIKSLQGSATSANVASLDPGQRESLMAVMRVALSNLYRGLGNNVRDIDFGVGRRGPAGLVLHWSKPESERRKQGDLLDDLCVFNAYLGNLLANLAMLNSIYTRRFGATITPYKVIDDALRGSVASPATDVRR
jgi:hypothetical protein